MNEYDMSETRYVASGGAAAMLGVAMDTLRRWEARGLITSERTMGNHRRYKVEDLVALREKMAERLKGGVK